MRPDEDVTLRAVLRSSAGDIFEFDTEAHTNGKRAANARLVFHVSTFAMAEPERARFSEWARQTFAELGGLEF